MCPHLPEGVAGLAFDFPSFRIGVAEYLEGPTGCTVFDFGRGAAFAADVRGGSPGTVNADVGFAHAICFAGGSMLGLEASAGVAAAVFERRGHAHVEWNDVPLVAGAVIYDYGRRRNGVYPDGALGRAAFEAARPGFFPLGRRGAGIGATVGKAAGIERAESAGQGGAFARTGGARVAAFTILNAVGVIVGREGRAVRGNLDPVTGQRHLFGEAPPASQRPRGNTTLTLLVTDRRLRGRELAQLARQVHASMARAIQPFHTETDGDVLFALTTSEADDETPLSLFGSYASEVAWDAVLASFEP